MRAVEMRLASHSGSVSLSCRAERFGAVACGGSAGTRRGHPQRGWAEPRRNHHGAIRDHKTGAGATGLCFRHHRISFHLFAPSKPNVGRGRAGEMRVPVQLVQDCVEDWSELSRRLEETEASLVTKEQLIEASFS